MKADEAEPVFKGYELTLVVAGPYYRDRIVIVDVDALGLQPTMTEINGLTYERYPGNTDDEWIEVRFDYIASRELRILYEDPKPPVPTLGGLDEEEVMELPAEDRVRERRHDG